MLRKQGYGCTNQIIALKPEQMLGGFISFSTGGPYICQIKMLKGML